LSPRAAIAASELPLNWLHRTGPIGVSRPSALEAIMHLRVAPGLLLLVLLAGCPSTPSESAKKNADPEAAIRQVFADFQGGLKAHDGAKLWDVLAEDSRQDADRKAKEIKSDFAKADEQQQAELAKKFALTAGDLRNIDGKGYLKTQQFFGLYHEVPDSNLKSVSVSGEKASLKFIEEDGDEVTMKLQQEQGHWKLIVEMPK
jgi:hypothetical protein